MKLKEKLAFNYAIENQYNEDNETAYLAGFEAALNLAARKFEGDEQRYSTDVDSIDLTYIVMAIMWETITQIGEDEV